MKFLIDAHLPRRIVARLQHAGHDALHTLDLPNGNCTTDEEINDISEREQRVVVTKDADFVNSFLLMKRPYRLLLISTGNITNADLEAILFPAVPSIVAAFTTAHYIELSRARIIIHS